MFLELTTTVASFNKFSTRLLLPFSTAKWFGVLPLLSSQLISILLCFNKMSAISLNSPETANCNGVQP